MTIGYENLPISGPPLRRYKVAPNDLVVLSHDKMGYEIIDNTGYRKEKLVQDGATLGKMDYSAFDALEKVDPDTTNSLFHKIMTEAPIGGPQAVMFCINANSPLTWEVYPATEGREKKEPQGNETVRVYFYGPQTYEKSIRVDMPYDKFQALEKKLNEMKGIVYHRAYPGRGGGGAGPGGKDTSLSGLTETDRRSAHSIISERGGMQGGRWASEDRTRRTGWTRGKDD